MIDAGGHCDTIQGDRGGQAGPTVNIKHHVVAAEQQTDEKMSSVK